MSEPKDNRIDNLDFQSGLMKGRDMANREWREKIKEQIEVNKKFMQIIGQNNRIEKNYIIEVIKQLENILK